MKPLGNVLAVIGGFLWLFSWIVALVVAFQQGTGWGILFIFLGITGPVAGLVEGIFWGNWTALGWGIVAIVLLGIGNALNSD